jgi:hypothetical protein
MTASEIFCQAASRDDCFLCLRRKQCSYRALNAIFSLESGELRNSRFNLFVSRIRVDYKRPMGNTLDLSQMHEMGMKRAIALRQIRDATFAVTTATCAMPAWLILASRFATAPNGWL